MTGKPSIYDARWAGPHGIGRFATEVRSRLSGDWDDLTGAHPVSVGGMLQLQRLAVSKASARRTFFSPGFCSPVGWRGPVVLTIHDLMHLDVPGEAGRGVLAYYERVVRPAVRRAPVTLTMSQHAKSRIVDWCGVADDRVVVVGNGVDATYTPEGPRFEPGYPYVFYVGNHKPHKNVPMLLRALADPALGELHLAMTGAPVPETMKLAQELGIGDRVHALGIIPESELPAHYRGAAAVAMPSLYEGFGLPVLEAMACGVPAVAGGVTAVPEIAGDGAILVDPNDLHAVVDGLKNAAFDSAVRQQLTVAGPQQAHLFDWECVGRRVEDALIVSGHG